VIHCIELVTETRGQHFILTSRENIEEIVSKDERAPKLKSQVSMVCTKKEGKFEGWLSKLIRILFNNMITDKYWKLLFY
jgi:hypothetical protein